MLAASASLLNIPIVILDNGAHAPAKQVVAVAPTTPHRSHLDGSFSDADKIRELAAKVDILTVEIEHVNVDVLEEVQSTHGVEVHPNPSAIHIIQDKFRQKEHLLSYALPVASSLPVDSTEQGITGAVATLGLPLMLKSRTLAYDGRGNYVLRELSQIQDALNALSERPLYAEKWVPFVKEIAVMVVRTTTGDTSSYPVVETIHNDNICHLVFAPFRSRDPSLSAKACGIAEKAVKSLSGAGVFGVEMFLLGDGTSTSHSKMITRPTTSPRSNSRERDRTSASQLGALHYRSVRDLTIRKSPPRDPRAPHRLDRPQSSLRSHAQHPRRVERHL